MKIPNTFKCAGFDITIEFLDALPENQYAIFCDVKNTISIANHIYVEKDKIKLTELQQLNSFLHELIHVFQFYYNNDYVEAEAQVYANFLQEFINTKC